MPMTDEILVSVSGHIAEIVLNRPQKHNAVTREMAARLRDICAEADRDEDVRVILIKGAGERAFSSGSDLNALAQYPSAWAFRNRVVYENVVRNIKKPVIAALKGWVLGGGGEMALAADIRVAGRSVKIGFPEVTRGWVGGGGASQMLPRLVGYGQAMRLLLSGEPVGADEAFRLGLVEYLVDDAEVDSTARALCMKIAGFSPVAVQSVKTSVRMALSSSLEAGLRYENEMNTLCFSAGDHMEGIKAFNEGRTAEFKR
jgi:enoyl-CoA hydratase/carnithine racemase